MIRVYEINDADPLADLRLVWDALLRRTRGATFFQSLDWLLVYWRHFGGGAALRVLVVEHAGDVLGIVPLAVCPEPTRLGRLRVLTYPLDDWGSFYGPIGPQPAATLLAAMRHLRRAARDWDLLDLRWIAADGHDAGRTWRAMQMAGFQARMQPRMFAALADLRRGWGAYWASRSGHFRREVQRCHRKLQRAGRLTYLWHRPRPLAQGDGDPRWELYDACEQIARHSWQAQSTNGTTLSHAAVRDFLRDAHQAAARAGAVDLHLLYVDDEPAAFVYNYHYQGYVSGVRMGYDPRVSRTGLGNCLLARSIATLCEQGDHTLDLGTEYLECKRVWATSIAGSYRCTHFPWAVPRAQLIRLKRWLVGPRVPEPVP
jgi:CelD/BcsL family acetyltransferase involved in cellulose biosynthesis